MYHTIYHVNILHVPAEGRCWIFSVKLLNESLSYRYHAPDGVITCHIRGVRARQVWTFPRRRCRWWHNHQNIRMWIKWTRWRRQCKLISFYASAIASKYTESNRKLSCTTVYCMQLLDCIDCGLATEIIFN